ncbi:MAG: dihydroorotate dehydrogenase-like protein [Planctomycetes bacterium]|nr:dihydroorotate dehydrogenase-like protein [Planctomycetota bacterium]
MPNLTTKYMGLVLRNPLIVGSSGLTQSLERLRKAEDAGAGAVVLKSIFEEQIEREVEGLAEASAPSMGHSEAMDYISSYGREHAVGEYLELIRGAKKALRVPVLASVHCDRGGSWTEFAKRAEVAGADGLELNIFLLPCDANRDGRSYEQAYLDIVREVRAQVKIPIALKVGTYFSGLAEFLGRLSRTGVNGLVLFNRFYRLDFDIENFRLIPAGSFSSPEEIVESLRWISLLVKSAGCDLAATTGIHDGAGVIKQLLAGAAATQVCSVLYKQDLSHLRKILGEVEEWMGRHGFETIEQFRGAMSRDQSDDPSSYLRVQFMRFSINAP